MLIYLDIDGVMVPANSWRRPEILQDGFPAFSIQATKALRKVLDETKGDIVLTSSHKFSHTLDQWLSIFERRGISLDHIDRLPKNEEHLSRKEELLSWFNSNSIDQDFIILDDDKGLNDLPAFLKEKLIQTSASVGLTMSLADEAIERYKKGGSKVLA